MVKPKDKPESEIRTPGPKGKRSIIPAGFQIRRPDNPMRMILDESEGRSQSVESRQDLLTSQVNQANLVIETSLDSTSRLDSVHTGDWTKSSLDSTARLDLESEHHQTSVDLMSSLPDVKG